MFTLNQRKDGVATLFLYIYIYLHSLLNYMHFKIYSWFLVDI